MAPRKAKSISPESVLENLNKALAIVGEDDNLPSVILEFLRDRFGGDHGMLLEPEESTGNLRELVSFGVIEEMLDQDMRIFAQYAMAHPDEEDSMILAPRAAGLKQLAARKSVRRDMTRQVLLFSLYSNDKTMAVVYLGSKGKKSLTLDKTTKPDLKTIGKTLGGIMYLDRTIRQLSLQNQALQRSVKGDTTFADLVGASVGIDRIKRSLSVVSGTDIPVTLIGEPGTGKKLIANIIHNNSNRSKKSFVRFSVAEVPEQMVHQLLFGQTSPRAAVSKTIKGALREAKGGTLLIEDIEKLPLSAQLQLMHALQHGEAIPVDGQQEYPVDVRLIAATSADLKKEYEAKNLREDLYRHLFIFPILVPALRDRTEDLPLLVTHFVEMAASQFGKKISGISSDIYDYLGGWEWPGNVAELETEIRKAVLRTPERGGTISQNSLSKHLISKREPAITLPKEGTLKQRIAGIEKHLIMDALEQYKHNQSTTADKLGLSRQALINKLHRYGIETGRKYKKRLKEIAAQAESVKE